jgi:LPXTG-motif cell wall-anchored protein
MTFMRRIPMIASALLLLMLTPVPAAAQQPAQPGGATKQCGTVNCPAECDCQLTICDKTANPGCQDVGVCVNCEGEGMSANQTMGIAALGVGLVAVVGLIVYRRRRQRVSP